MNKDILEANESLKLYANDRQYLHDRPLTSIASYDRPAQIIYTGSIQHLYQDHLLKSF